MWSRMCEKELWAGLGETKYDDDIWTGLKALRRNYGIHVYWTQDYGCRSECFHSSMCRAA